MKIFLDVGSHRGQTLEEVIQDSYCFDVIHCFEPMPAEYEYLLNKFSSYSSSKKVNFHNFGLLDKNTTLDLYGTNVDMGSSIFHNKQSMKGGDKATQCQFKMASEFFAENIDKNDLVIMKLNVEGSECIIMNDLLDSKECFKIDNVMIDFDIRKIPGKQNDENLLLERFKHEGFNNYCLSDQAMKGSSHQKRIQNWLSSLDFSSDFMHLSNTQKIRRLIKKPFPYVTANTE